MNWQHGLLLLCALLFTGCVLAAFLPRLMVRRNRRINLPPPSTACERKYDAGWWS